MGKLLRVDLTARSYKEEEIDEAEEGEEIQPRIFLDKVQERSA